MSRFVSSVLVCCLLALPSIAWSKPNPKTTSKTVTKTSLQAVPTIESLKKQCLATKGVAWNDKTNRCELNRRPVPVWPIVVVGTSVAVGALAAVIAINVLDSASSPKNVQFGGDFKVMSR
jgi:hypothetical protein